MKKLVLLTVLSFMVFGLKAQNSNCWGTTTEDSLQCLEKITLFRTFYEKKDYRDAYENWQFVVNKYPCSWDALYTYSQTMFDNLIKEETDSLAKIRLVDSLLWTYQVRHTFFPQKFTEGSGIGLQATNMLRYKFDEIRKDVNAFKNIYNMFVQSIDLEEEKTQPSIWDNYFKVAIQMVRIENDTTILIEAYERATTYIDKGIIEQYKRYDKQLAGLENLQQRFDAKQIENAEYNKVYQSLSRDTARAMIFINTYKRTLANIELLFTPFAPCNVLIEVYTLKMPSIRDNITALKKMLTLFQNSKDCPKINPVFIEGLEIVHKAAPTGTTAFMMGNRLFQQENKTPEDYNTILAYYNEAATLFETNIEKATAHYMIANVYLILEKFVESRAAALEAIKLNPNYGNAYILIGDLYEQSGSRCSGGDALPYAYNWAAADKYSKAASVDPSVAEKASAKRSSLTFPRQNDKFVRGLNAGDSYRVGCWINESTTVR